MMLAIIMVIAFGLMLVVGFAIGCALAELEIRAGEREEHDD